MNKTIVVGEADRSTHRRKTERVATETGITDVGSEGGTSAEIVRIALQEDTTGGTSRIVTGRDETGAAGS